MSAPFGSARSDERICCSSAGTCSGVSARINVPEMFCLPLKTSLSALLLHSPAPPDFDEREPSFEKLYSHGSFKNAGRYVAAYAVATSGTMTKIHGHRSVTREIPRIAGPLEPSRER